MKLISTKKKDLFLVTLLLLLILTAGCQSNKQSESRPTVRTEKLKMANSKTTQKATTTQDSNYNDKQAVDRKIIKEANLKIITKDLNNLTKQINRIVKNNNAYLANSNQWQSNRKHYRFEIKTPQKKFQTTILELEKIGEVTSKQINSRDITQEYIDLQARLDNFKAQEKRYLELLDKAKKVEEILKVEKELNRVRRKIEQLQGQLNYYNNKIDYSTINVTITEPEPVMNNNNWGFINSFKKSIQEFVTSINSIIVIFGALLPWVSLFLLIAFFIYKIYQKKK